MSNSPRKTSTRVLIQVLIPAMVLVTAGCSGKLSQFQGQNGTEDKKDSNSDSKTVSTQDPSKENDETIRTPTDPANVMGGYLTCFSPDGEVSISCEASDFSGHSISPRVISMHAAKYDGTEEQLSPVHTGRLVNARLHSGVVANVKSVTATAEIYGVRKTFVHSGTPPVAKNTSEKSKQCEPLRDVKKEVFLGKEPMTILSKFESSVISGLPLSTSQGLSKAVYVKGAKLVAKNGAGNIFLDLTPGDPCGEKLISEQIYFGFTAETKFIVTPSCPEGASVRFDFESIAPGASCEIPDLIIKD